MKTFLRQMRALVALSLTDLWRRNDLYALAVLAVALMVPLSMASPFGAAGASRYLDEAALLLIWAFSLVISLATGSRLFPPEFESRTIYALFARPVSRWRVLLGKFFGAVVASWSALAVFYVVFAVSAASRGAELGSVFVQTILLHAAFVAVAVSVSLFTTLVATPSAGLTLSAIALTGMFFFGRRLPEYAHTAGGPGSWFAYLAYAIAPHAEFFDMRQRLVHGWGGVGWEVVGAVLAYAAAYALACLAISALALRRKRL